MRSKALVAAAILALPLSACGEEALSDDPEVAGQQVDEKVQAEADTLEEAAAKAVEMRNAEIESDTQDIMAETDQGSSSAPAN